MATREQLKHAIRSACQIVEQPGVIIIGSQSILATWPEYALPDEATQSQELDVCPLADDDAQSLADRLEGAIGEWSTFHETYGFYIDGVGRDTATLPEGFEDRLIPVADDETRGYAFHRTDAWRNHEAFHAIQGSN